MNKKSNLEKWAEKEVELVCKDGEIDYNTICYKSALKAFNILCEDGHSGMSIQMTKHILNRLIDGKPLTPIEDTNDVWYLESSIENYQRYQCNRMFSLFKNVYPDGRINYYDENYCYCIDYNNHNKRYTLKLASDIIHEMFPITMPYIPDKPFKIYCTDFLFNINNGDFDTFAIHYVINQNDEQIFINRYFKEDDSTKYPRWIEISETEYLERLKYAKTADID